MIYKVSIDIPAYVYKGVSQFNRNALFKLFDYNTICNNGNIESISYIYIVPPTALVRDIGKFVTKNAIKHNTRRLELVQRRLISLRRKMIIEIIIIFIYLMSRGQKICIIFHIVKTNYNITWLKPNLKRFTSLTKGSKNRFVISCLLTPY